MLPVNSKSRLTAGDFVAKVSASTCIPDWMKTIFSANGNDLKIADKFTLPKKGTKPPAWFQSWYNAAVNVWQRDEWELTTGTLEILPKGLSLMKPDGISIGKVEPSTGSWVPYYQFENEDKGIGGLTVPTQQMKDDLNADKDAKLHYGGAIVQRDKSGKARGAIVVVDQLKTEKGEILPQNANDITGILFHELFHAGQVSGGTFFQHSDDRFQKMVDPVDAQFRHCAAP